MDRDLDWGEEEVLGDLLIHSLDKHLVLLLCGGTQKCLIPLRPHWCYRGYGTTGPGVVVVGVETLDL